MQKKHLGETTETKPVFDFEGRKALVWPSLELFTTGETSARNDKGRGEPALGLWSRADDFTESHQIHSCMILPVYWLVSLHNLMALLCLLLGHLAVPVACRESRGVALRMPGVHAWQGAPHSEKDATNV